MKKILIVNSHIPWGGLGQFTLSLVDGLKSNNYEIYGMITHSDSDNFSLFDEKVDYNHNIGNLGKIKKYFSAIRYIYSIKPDVIIINYNAVIHFILPFLPKTKVIDIIHNDVEDFYRISNINSKYVNLWIAPTPGIKNGFLEYTKNAKLQMQNTKVVSHGVGLSKNDTDSKGEDIFNIIFVGAVYEHKGADLLPEIFNKIKQKSGNVKLYIVGDGILRKELELKFEELDLIKDVSFYGVISHEEVRKMMAESHVLLFPTRVEAFGLVIAEAMMEGAVPVVTLLEGITDATVENSKTGYLIEENNIEEFSDKIIELVKNKELYNMLSAQTKDYAKEHLSISSMSAAYDKEIKRLINE